TITVSVADLETPAGALQLSATSSNHLLLPDANITFAGNTATRTINLAPAKDMNGVTTVFLKVTDGAGASTTQSFTLAVMPVNDPPVVVVSPSQTTFEDSGPQSYLVNISDIDNAPETLVMGGSSSNQALVPDANISFSGTGPTRSITVLALPNTSGTAV